MSYITVKPATGLRVVMPPALGTTRGLPLPEEGARVLRTPFVERRLKCGDLVEVEEGDTKSGSAKGKQAAEQAAPAVPTEEKR